MRAPSSVITLVNVALLVLVTPFVDTAPAGKWTVLVEDAGIATMHTAVTRYDTVILLDRTNTGASRINFTNGYCRDNPDERSLKHDCSAHSVMLDPSTTSLRPLTILTDTWCSSGQFAADGTLVQTGGDYEGLYKIRRLEPCSASSSCDWVESESEELVAGRWYATNQLLPDGSQIVIGGRGVNSYEFLPKRTTGGKTFELDLLSDARDDQKDNMYPFVHLLPDGSLFIFANRDSILLDYERNVVKKTYPKIPGEPRNYPSAGSSVLLPLEHAHNFTVAEVLVCGGSEYGAARSSDGYKWPASETCGRIEVTSDEAEWKMETMPVRRTMGDMIILPVGDVLIINGAKKGCQGWGKASAPALNPVQYATGDTDERFRVLAATTIPRLYHSTANLLSDGRVLLAGSNSHRHYNFSGKFPTELRVEAFDPPYLDSGYDDLRPLIHRLHTTSVTYGSRFQLEFTLGRREGKFEVNLLNSPFNTHSFSQGQRMVKLATTKPELSQCGTYVAWATAPASATVAPQSWYMVFAVQACVPGKGVWVQISDTN